MGSAGVNSRSGVTLALAGGGNLYSGNKGSDGLKGDCGGEKGACSFGCRVGDGESII